MSLSEARELLNTVLANVIDIMDEAFEKFGYSLDIYSQSEPARPNGPAVHGLK